MGSSPDAHSATKRPLQYLQLDPSNRHPLLKADKRHTPPLDDFPVRKSQVAPASSSSSTSPTSAGGENARVIFIGTATTVIEWHGLRILTDPNFLHAGDHVHLGPGVTAQRVTNPAVNLDQLPPVDVILLSHYHADHFDQLVEDSLDRDFPIVTTPHAKGCLTGRSTHKNDPFRNVTELDFFESAVLLAPQPEGQKRPVLGYSDGVPSPVDSEIATGYRAYISGDTLFVDDLKKIPEWLGGARVDLMLIHLGGTTIPGPSAPLVMVTMDAKQGLQLMRLVDPDVTIPVHYDDYDVFLSSLEEFKAEVEQGKMAHRVVYLDRGDEYRFKVAPPPEGHIGTY
ncbi:unnamed protein product [Parascedosporium putredinis]|uniref:Metallo-beta-lactamase domain-containing protein n=1 Tax=Parascedosporium putredinis TaxID=1442378 RepID=A0A9P1H858_9PEZI|nr:unnamed protein product [Parascedosporium putredinis]CAI8000598.1 unnamed protein product [Parascedosporium putredinis]